MTTLTADTARIASAFQGHSLYGDDFNAAEIAAWFRDEEDGYFELASSGGDIEQARHTEYNYAQLAHVHAFSRLPDRTFPTVLGVGCAHGAELRPILARSESITILEPSDGFAATELDGKPVKYVKPQASGLMPFADQSFDLIVCFSVLHHIPNVSTVVREMFRALKPGGHVLLREPITSMGDWRKPRRGLTKRERGIPFAIFRDIVRQAGFTVDYEARCVFSLTPKLGQLLRFPVWRSRWAVRIDRLACALPIWPRVYHATRTWHRFRPTAAAFVLSRP